MADMGRVACGRRLGKPLGERDAALPASVEPLGVRRGARGALSYVMAGARAPL